jgi:ribose transport system ATP-binding protein
VSPERHPVALGGQGSSRSSVGVEARDIHKSYGPVRAVEAANFAARFGEVHALVGENGAGKSTLIKILCGVARPDSGAILVRGQEASFSGPLQAQRAGIGTVFQELTLMRWMSVAENLLINVPPRGFGGLISRRKLPELGAEVLAQYGLERIDPRALAADLSVADQQLIEIVRALQRRPDILFLDEPTAALSETEVDWLFSLVRDLRDNGVCTVFTSHRWREIETVADWITVFRNGRDVGTARTMDEDEAIQLMTGRTLERIFPKPPAVPESQPALRVKDLVADGVRSVSFEIRPGEILGIGGLAGHGQRQLFLSLFGAHKVSGGTIEVQGRRKRIRKPLDAIRSGMGIALVPEDRKSEGLFMPMSVRDNLSLAQLPALSRFGLIRWGKERASVGKVIRTLAIRSAAPTRDRVSAMSGGNQQKVLIGRWLATDAQILLLYDVTRGVDVATKQEIYQLIVEQAAAGKAVLFFSSETEEMAHLCQRVLVLREGRVNAELTGDDVQADQIVAAAMKDRSQ